MSSILRPLQLEDTTPEPVRSLAKSRRPVAPPNKPIFRPRFSPKEQSTLPSVSLPAIPWKEYFLHLPILMLGLLAYIGVAFIFLTIEPASIQNVLLPNTYLPLLAVAAAGHFCLFSFLFLNSRRGFLISLGLTALLFLRLQQVLTVPLTFWITLSLISIELAVLLVSRLVSQAKGTLSLPKLPQWKYSASRSEAARNPELQPFTEPPKHTPKHGRKRKRRFFGK